MAGMALKMPELAISQDESKDLAEAVTIVGKEYGVKVTGKTAASLNLLLTAAIVYGPRVYMIMQRKNAGINPAPSVQHVPSADLSGGGVAPINWQ